MTEPRRSQRNRKQLPVEKRHEGTLVIMVRKGGSSKRGEITKVIATNDGFVYNVKFEDGECHMNCTHKQIETMIDNSLSPKKKASSRKKEATTRPQKVSTLAHVVQYTNTFYNSDGTSLSLLLQASQESRTPLQRTLRSASSKAKTMGKENRTNNEVIELLSNSDSDEESEAKVNVVLVHA